MYDPLGAILIHTTSSSEFLRKSLPLNLELPGFAVLYLPTLSSSLKLQMQTISF